MKINEITESKQRVDEFNPLAPITAAAGGVLSYAMLAAEYGADPFGNFGGKKWPQKAWLELGADVAIGATGIGLLGLGYKAVKGLKVARRIDKVKDQIKARNAAKKVVKALQDTHGGMAGLNTAASKVVGASTKLGSKAAKKAAKKFDKEAKKAAKKAEKGVGPAGEPIGPVEKGWERTKAVGRGSLKVPGKALRAAGYGAVLKTQHAQDAADYLGVGDTFDPQFTRKIAKGLSPAGAEEPGTAKPAGEKSKDSGEKPKVQATKPEEKRGPTALQQWKWGKGGRKFPGMDK